jgi:general secretion pathway protein E
MSRSAGAERAPIESRPPAPLHLVSVPPRAAVASPGVLTLSWLLAECAKEGLISLSAATELGAHAKKGSVPLHPLVAIAAQEWPDRRASGRSLTLETLTQWLAQRVELPYVRIDPLKLDVARMTDLVPHAYAQRVGILPIKCTATEITFAVKDPFTLDWLQELAPILKLPVKRVLANPLDIERYLTELYSVANSVKTTDRAQSKLAPAELRNLEQLTELSQAGKLSAEDSHVVAIVDWLLQYAFDTRASDIHLEPRRDTANVRFRIDGKLHDVYQLPAPVMPAITSRIKILSRLDIAERRRPQDGRIRTRSPDGKEIELRVSVLPTAFGEKLVLRIFNPDVAAHDFAKLGLSATEAKSWRGLINQPHGIVLVTGPTGSGKTTTLYSSLKELATTDVNVCTIEDPIEMIDGRFNQMQVAPTLGLTFADGVRALLRQDPDIIMIGEIRDRETAEVAVQAALTGHLVISTLHTNDSPSAITRLLELGIPAYLVRATLIGVLAQRLVRTLCADCKAPRAIESGQWDSLGLEGALAPPTHLYHAVGCLECRQTGYLGRSGVYELMSVNAAVQAAIDSTPDIPGLRGAAIAGGMRPLRRAGAEMIAAGLTTLDEVLALTPDPRR